MKDHWNNGLLQFTPQLFFVILFLFQFYCIHLMVINEQIRNVTHQPVCFVFVYFVFAPHIQTIIGYPRKKREKKTLWRAEETPISLAPFLLSALRRFFHNFLTNLISL